MKKETIQYQLVNGEAAANLKEGSLIKYVADLIVAAGGNIARKELLPQLEEVLKREKPELKSSASVVLSFQQRHLRDNGIIKMTDTEGNEIVTAKRGPRKQAEAETPAAEAPAAEAPRVSNLG